MLSSLVATYKGKNYPLNIKSYRGTKLLEYIFKLYQRIHRVLKGITLLYSCCKTAVFVDGELSDFFFVQVGVHLSPLLFAIVMDAPTESVRDGSRGLAMKEKILCFA